jgi:hypothetical protein
VELVEHQVGRDDGPGVEVGRAPPEAVGRQQEAAQHLIDGGKSHVRLEARVFAALAGLEADAVGAVAAPVHELVGQHAHGHGVDALAREIQPLLAGHEVGQLGGVGLARAGGRLQDDVAAASVAVRPRGAENRVE